MYSNTMIKTIMCAFKLKMEGSCSSLPINRQLLGMFMVNQRRLQQWKQQSHGHYAFTYLIKLI